VLPHTEVVRLSRIIRAGLSLEDHKSRWEYNINDKRSFVVQCSYLFAHLVFFFLVEIGAKRPVRTPCWFYDKQLYCIFLT
jgi:hypothetical protein